MPFRTIYTQKQKRKLAKARRVAEKTSPVRYQVQIKNTTLRPSTYVRWTTINKAGQRIIFYKSKANAQKALKKAKALRSPTRKENRTNEGLAKWRFRVKKLGGRK